MKPLIKWTGGKRALVTELMKFVPETYGRYYEPFAGGAALFFALEPANATLGDANRDLIATYSAISDNTDELIWGLEAHARSHSEVYYLEMRKRWNRRDLLLPRPAAFLYLIRTCFNGLWRVNKRGLMNSPIGTPFPKDIVQESNLRRAAELIARASLLPATFQRTLSDVRHGDFVYLDPPFDGTFNGYTSDSVDQEQVAAEAERCSDLGATVVVSSSDTPTIRELYSGWNLREVTRAGTMNSDKTKRQRVRELIITRGNQISDNVTRMNMRGTR